MRKIFLILSIMLTGIISANAQEENKISFSGYLGTGLAMSTPDRTPITLHAIGYYNISNRFSAGMGTGVSVYETTLIPLYADVKYKFSSPHKFTPYAECGCGYSFAPQKNTNGGFYFSPSIGVEWSAFKKNKVLFAVGYELQEFERLKQFENQYIKTEFQESLSHGAIALKVGMTF